MGKKEDTSIVLPDDVGHSFEDEHFVLHYRPKIEFVEPEQEVFEYDAEPEPPTIDEARDRTQKLINGFGAIAKLADLMQQRIDNRVKAAGGVEVKLDPSKDAAAIAAMKRRFPDKKDPTKITYDDYKKVLDCVGKSAATPPAVSADDIRAAKSDPLRTDFGGLSNQQGENRPEISSPASAVQPVDSEAFQASAVLALFALLLPLIKTEDKLEIEQHKVDTPHK